MSSELTIDQWRLFVLLAQHGSVTKVAATQGVAQSAVSRSLNALEKGCRGRLFHRTGRGVTLTDAAAALYPRVLSWLSEADRLETEARTSAQDPAGVVHFGVLPSTEHPLINLVFQRAKQQFPKIRLRVVAGSTHALNDALEKGEIDIAILYRYGTHISKEVPLTDVDFYLVGAAGDPATAPATVPFSKLHGLALVLPSSPNPLRRFMEQLARKKDVELSVMLECDSLDFQKSIVAASELHAVMGLRAITDELRRGDLQAARIVAPSITNTITLCTSNYRPTTLACREISRLVRICAAELFESQADGLPREPFARMLPKQQLPGPVRGI